MVEMDCFGGREFSAGDLISLDADTSSKGNQAKWLTKDRQYFVKGPFDYQGIVWKDYLVELLAEEICRQLDISTIGQRKCRLVGCSYDDAVYSRNFHLDGYEFVSFNRILKRKGTEFPVNAFPLAKLDFILDVVMGLEGRCFSRDQYLAYILKFNLVDIIVGNEDRHLNNFGVFRKGGYVTIPLLFDFGLGLFGHDRRYYRCETLDDAIEKMECKPFYDSPVGNAMWMKKQFPEFLQGILPKRLLLGKGLIPNSLAFGYLGYICGVLGTEVQYV